VGESDQGVGGEGRVIACAGRQVTGEVSAVIRSISFALYGKRVC
jgi:hypothetical protein